MGIGVDCVCFLWFLRLVCARSLLWYLCPSRAFVMCSPLELVIMPLLGWQLLPSPSLAGSQTWMSSTTRGRRLTFEGQSRLLHSMGREQRWDHLRVNPGFKYSGSSLPSCPSLSPTNLLYRKDFLRSAHGVGVIFFHEGLQA